MGGGRSREQAGGAPAKIKPVQAAPVRAGSNLHAHVFAQQKFALGGGKPGWGF